MSDILSSTFTLSALLERLVVYLFGSHVGGLVLSRLSSLL
jgi:hypothetical protein